MASSVIFPCRHGNSSTECPADLNVSYLTPGRHSYINVPDHTTANTSSVTMLEDNLDYHLPKYDDGVMVAICIVLGGMILAIILGNIFVITAILVERSLRGVSNYLILSLSITDLLVAVLVMPLSLTYEISLTWFLGDTLCDMYISMDVLCCTASILHLVAISLDRYWAVSNIDYVRRRSARQILMMVVVVWTVSVFISIPPLFGWKGEADYQPGQCLISQEPGYTVFSTVGAFYCPLFLMIIINLKIYKAARYRIRKKRFGGRMGKHQALQVPIPVVTVEAANVQKQLKRNSSGSEVSQDGMTMYMPSCMVGNNSGNDASRGSVTMESPIDGEENGTALLQQRPGGGIGKLLSSSLAVPVCNVAIPLARPAEPSVSNNNVNKRRRNDKERREKLEMRRERKAARVLGIITGAFVFCWLPFFVVAVVRPMCGMVCELPHYWYSLFLWLGYFNSLINPIIYTIFNPSFRCAFKKVFFRRVKSLNRSSIA